MRSSGTKFRNNIEIYKAKKVRLKNLDLNALSSFEGK